MANTKEDLLVLFKDNSTNDITAEVLRTFITDVYAQMVLIDDIVDTYDSSALNLALSAGRGKYLNDRLVIAENTIVTLEARIAALEV